jgi:hypothetical protein
VQCVLISIFTCIYVDCVIIFCYAIIIHCPYFCLYCVFASGICLPKACNGFNVNVMNLMVLILT